METLINAVGPELIAVAVPIVVALIKGLIPRIPKPLLPVLAAAIGPAAAMALDALGAIEATGATLALIGVAGVGIREVFNQIGKWLVEDRDGSTVRCLGPAAMAALMLVGCGGPVTQTLARGVDEACARFNANPLTALPLRKQTVGAINALTMNGNYTPADCDNDGESDFPIDANGQPLPDVP